MDFARRVVLLGILGGISACQQEASEKRLYGEPFPLQELQVADLKIVPWTNDGDSSGRHGTHRAFFTLNNLSTKAYPLDSGSPYR